MYAYTHTCIHTLTHTHTNTGQESRIPHEGHKLVEKQELQNQRQQQRRLVEP